MNTAEILQAKDLRIQVLEEQLTACKSDRKRLKKQLKLYVVTFCLPIEGDTFENWFYTHFFIHPNKKITTINNETIKYTQDEILDIWHFLTDRLVVN